MPNEIKVAVNKTTRVVTLLKGGSATPSGSVDAGSFLTRKNKAPAAFVWELLYKLKINNVAFYRLISATGTDAPNFSP